MKKNVCKLFLLSVLILNVMVMPICAENTKSVTVDLKSPRYNNISNASLYLGYDDNNIARCSIVVTPYTNCSGISGLMRLVDSNGNMVGSWAITDYESPYSVTRNCQCQAGKEYTLTFQGYAYSNDGTIFDDIELEIKNTCN
jgi:hypothetical protein